MPPTTRAIGALALLVALSGPAPALVGAETTKDLLGCQKALDKEAAKLVKTRGKYLAQCVTELLVCQLEYEIDGAALAPCQASGDVGLQQRAHPRG